MATVSDLSLRDRFWYMRYRFRKVDPLPWAPPGPSPGDATLAVVTSAGIHPAHGPPFERIQGGDFSYRWIRADVPVEELISTHPSDAWDRSGVEADGNLALPLDRLREMVDEGALGALAPRHASFQGSITAPLRLLKQTAPEVARQMVDDGVDMALLTPV